MDAGLAEKRLNLIDVMVMMGLEADDLYEPNSP
jgi:hypothetical protein